MSHFLPTQMIHTNDYPFAFKQTKALVPLAYTSFASDSVCDQLKIHKFGYRRILTREAKEKKGGKLLFIVRDGRIKEPKLKVSYQLFRKSGKNIYLERIIKQNIQISGLLFPNFPHLSELHLYLHPNNKYEQFITSIITNSPFIIQMPKQVFYVDASWIEENQILNGFSIRSMLQIRRKIWQNKQTEYHNYFKIQVGGIVEGEQEQYGIFIPNKTKLKIIKNSHTASNFVHTEINIDSISQSIYERAPYQKFIKEFSLINQKEQIKIIYLTVQAESGLCPLVHQYANKKGKYFHSIDCNDMLNQKQLITAIQEIASYSSSIIYVKNIDWFQQLNTKLDSSQQIKRIIQTLESIVLQSIIPSSISNHTIILQCCPTSKVAYDMMKQIQVLDFSLTKVQKLQIFSYIIDSMFTSQGLELLAKAEIQQLTNTLVGSFGWTKLVQILTISLQTLKKSSITGDILLNQLTKHTKIQKVQNIKSITWDDIGGLQTAKQQIIQTILLPTKHPQLFDDFIKPRTGLLFYGPPGTGKTMLGKCIANECKMGFISVKGPELLNMYIGESQKNVREVFERAAASSPCIIFMDQLDALIPKRGNSNDSNQVMDRIVAELLMQMDRASKNGIFVIGATNRPDLLDTSIMRPGRFDKQIYLGISADEHSRKQILKAQTRKLNLAENFDYDKVLENIPKNFTGADFYGLTSKSIMRAADRAIEQCEREEKIGQIEPKQEDFIETAKVMTPSVSLKELEHYEKLKNEYK